MNTLKGYVNFKLTHADKVAEAEGYPLTMENCKKNKKMKQLQIYGNTVQDGTPTPDAPIDMQSVGEKSVNLFDKDTYTRLNSWGAGNVKVTETGISFEVTNSDGNGFYMLDLGLASDYAGKTLTLSSPSYYLSPATVVGIRDMNSATTIKDGSAYTYKDGLYYSTLKVEDAYTDEHLFIRLYYATQELGSVIEYKDIMLAESNTPLPYEPYGKYKIPVVVKGINLFDKTKVVDGYIQDLDGNNYVATSFKAYASEFIEIEANQSYIMTKTPNLNWGAFYDENKQFIKGINGYSKGCTSPSNAKYIRLTVPPDYVDTFQLQKGTTATEYEPYIEPVTTNIFLDEPLRKLGDYADYIDFKENKVVRKCVKKYLSNYNWNPNYITEFDNGSYGFLTEDRSIVPDYYNNLPNSAYGFSNVFPMIHKTNYAGYTFVIWVATWASNVRIAIPAEYLTEKSVSALKTWLAENDVYMICIQKTPTEEEITCTLPKTTSKTTIIEVDTSLAPSNAYGKYIKR